MISIAFFDRIYRRQIKKYLHVLIVLYIFAKNKIKQNI
jgi:hypothetical protein